MNCENFRERFETLAKLVPEHEHLKLAFKFFMIFKVTTHMKFFYAAYTVLGNLEDYALILDNAA